MMFLFWILVGAVVFAFLVVIWSALVLSGRLSDEEGGLEEQAAALREWSGERDREVEARREWNEYAP